MKANKSANSYNNASLYKYVNAVTYIFDLDLVCWTQLILI